MTQPNVLLIVMDSVRAANTSLHGHEHETTPFLDELAKEATVYEQARSPGTWSLPSHTSMFTGYHVAEHGVTSARHRVETGHSIFDELRREGYETGVFSENTWIADMECGLKDAFDRVEGPRNLPFPDAIDPSNFALLEGEGRYVKFLKTVLSRDDAVKSLANGVYTKLAWDYPALLPKRFTTNTSADVYADLFLDWEANTDGPWGACLNLMDAHLPYQPTTAADRWGGKRLRKLQNDMQDQVWEFHGERRPWWQRRALEGLYDGTIYQIDLEVRRIVETLRERDELDNTFLVVTSDHGEGFGEVSRIRDGARVAGHGIGIHESLCHVPLVVRRPDQDAPRRVQATASLTEFPQVVRSLIKGDGEHEFASESPVFVSSTGLDEPMRERATNYAGDVSRFEGSSHAVFTSAEEGVEKDVSWSGRGCRVKVVDAKTSWRVADHDGESVNEQIASLGDPKIKSGSDEGPDVNETTRQQLERLGYM